MKLDLNRVLIMLNTGEPIQAPPGQGQDGSMPYTMGRVMADALVAAYPTENPAPSGTEKAMRYKLAQRCIRGGEQSFEQNDIDRMAVVADLAYATLFYGQIAEWLGIAEQPETQG